MMRPNPHQRVASAVELVALEGIGIASVTVWEILNGIGGLDRGRRRSDLRARFETVLDEAFDGRVLDWTLADAPACADIMEAKRRLGQPLDDHLPDAMIAATAVTRSLTVLTRDEQEFRNTGAKWVNPCTGLADLVGQALAGGRISMGRAAELLQVSREEMRSLSQRWTLDQAR